MYDKDQVYFDNETISHDQRFLGNTSIDYDGEYIAIWKVDDPCGEDVELLVANLVHEMFHAYQLKHNEGRYPKDLLLLDYPKNIEN